MPFVGSAASARRWLVLLPIVIIGLVAAAVAAERNWSAVRDLRLDIAPPDVAQSKWTGAVNGRNAYALVSRCPPVEDLATFDPSANADAIQGIKETCVTDQLASGAHGAGVLTQITTWRREGNAVVLIRPSGLHHRLGSN